MKKKITVLALCAALFAFSVSADAQQATKTPRIGYLGGTSPSADSARTAAFRQGLRELGYVEGKNIVIEYRYSEGKLDRGRAFAAELMRFKVAVIVTGGSTTTRAAKEATTGIPIIMTQDPDPIGNGFVVSLARPGGNVTGSSNYGPELSGKRLELLREIVPQAHPRGRLRDFYLSRQRTDLKRNGTRRRGARGAASIHRRIRS